jgi:flavin reductase (DIM6/NTAB) family NADH-FMN oxidoreductase RutF
MKKPEDGSIALRRVLGHFPAGVVIVTAMAVSAPAGMSAESFTSVSLDPPLIAILPARSSAAWPHIAAAGVFCVNVLSARQEPLYRRFAAGGDAGDAAFAEISWRPAPSGAPILVDSLAWIDCELEQTIEAGDHLIALGRVRALDIADGEPTTPLVAFRGSYGTISGDGR